MKKIIKTKFKDLLVFEGINHMDSRGFLREVFLENKIKNTITFHIVSKSKKNVLRGLHFQKKKAQGKYVSVIKGKIFDVVVDLRKNSKTFGKSFSVVLSQKNCKSIYIPPGFIHGFLALESENIVIYGCTNYRDKESEIGIKWNDEDLNINWSISKPIISIKDKKNISFKEYLKQI